jgi:hypothetical protein
MMDFREFGKWLLDIAKYVVTAGLVSTLFQSFEDKWLLYLVGSIFVMLLVFWGMFFIHKSKK